MSEISILILKMPLLLSNLGEFSEHKFEKSIFLTRTWIEYFHMGIFVILWVYLIKKIWVSKPCIFFCISVLSRPPCVYFARGYVSINFRKKVGSNRIAAFYTTANELSLHARIFLNTWWEKVKRFQKKNKIKGLPDMKEWHQRQYFQNSTSLMILVLSWKCLQNRIWSCIFWENSKTVWVLFEQYSSLIINKRYALFYRS